MCVVYIIEINNYVLNTNLLINCFLDIRHTVYINVKNKTFFSLRLSNERLNSFLKDITIHSNLIAIKRLRERERERERESE